MEETIDTPAQASSADVTGDSPEAVLEKIRADTELLDNKSRAYHLLWASELFPRLLIRPSLLTTDRYC